MTRRKSFFLRGGWIVVGSIGDVRTLEEILMLDARSCPVTVINGDVIVGFDQERIERLLGIT